MPETEKKLQAWMRFGQPLEPVVRNFKAIFDAWEAMGVNGIVLGRMYFRDDDNKYHAILGLPNKRPWQNDFRREKLYN